MLGRLGRISVPPRDPQDLAVDLRLVRPLAVRAVPGFDPRVWLRRAQLQPDGTAAERAARREGDGLGHGGRILQREIAVVSKESCRTALRPDPTEIFWLPLIDMLQNLTAPRHASGPPRARLLVAQSADRGTPIIRRVVGAVAVWEDKDDHEPR